MYLRVGGNPKAVAFWVFRVIVSKLVYYSGFLWLFKQLRRIFNGDNGILILAYHRINDFKNDVLDMAVTPRNFEAQIKHFLRHYHILSLDEAVRTLKEKDKIPRNAVVLTFDDGYKDNFDVLFPIVKKYNAPITVFVSVGYVELSKPFWWDQIIHSVYQTSKIDLNLNSFRLGNYKLKTKAEKRNAIYKIVNKLKEFVPSRRENIIKHLQLRLQTNSNYPEGCNVMNWNEIDKMKHSGVTIASHGMSHTILSRLSNSEAEFEICESKKILEKQLHTNVKFFSYPNGRPEDLNNKIIELIERVGYSAACTWMHGYNKVDNIEGFFRLKRVSVAKDICTGIFGGFSKSLFETELSGLFDILMFRRLRGRL